jgi:hypothetical protein
MPEFLLVVPSDFIELLQTPELNANITNLQTMANGQEWSMLTQLLVEIGAIQEGPMVVDSRIFGSDGDFHMWVKFSES